MVVGEWEGNLDDSNLPSVCRGYDCLVIAGNLTIEDSTDVAAQALVDEIDSIGGDITIYRNN
jgi:hypothetical protein